MSLLRNVEGSVELNHNMLCVYGLSKGCNSGMTEYINLEFSGNDKGDNQLTKKVIFERCFGRRNSISEKSIRKIILL